MTAQLAPVPLQRATKFFVIFFSYTAPGQNHEIQCWHDSLVPSETFPDYSLYTIPHHSRFNLLFGYCQPQPGMCRMIIYCQHGKIFICAFVSSGKYPFELRRPEQPQTATESLLTTQNIRLTVVCVLWRAGHSGSFDRFGFSFGRENRGFAYASDCWAGMFSSWLFPFKFVDDSAKTPKNKKK